MAGLPIVASDWKYNKELVIDGVTGLLFKPRDIDELVNKLLTLINSDYFSGEARIKCFEHSFLYTPDKALLPLFIKIEDKE